MSLHSRICDELNNGEITLLSQIQINDDEYDELIDYTRNMAVVEMAQTTIPPNVRLSVALVQIAIKHYSEGNYWDYFKLEIGRDISSTRANYLGQVFLSTLKYYKLFQLEKEEGKNFAYVENIKAHAFVPNNYMPGYFEFLYAFYNQNLLRQLPENIDDDFSEMSDFFVNTLKDSSDDFILDNFDNRPPKSYKLLKATRSLIAKGEARILSNLMYGHLKLIDDFYYDEIKPNISNRFGAAFIEWVNQSSEIKDNKNKGNKRRNDIFYHKPYFQIDRYNMEAWLVIPEQKFRNDSQNEDVFITIQLEDEVYEQKLSLYKAFGVLISEPISIQINNIFSAISITISSSTDKKFTIPKQSYRIFDEEFIEMLKLQRGQNYILAEKGTKISGVEPIYKYTFNSDWDEYSYGEIDEKATIYIDSCPISINGKFAIGANFSLISNDYKVLINDREIQSTFKHPLISFKISKKTFDGTSIMCNSTRIPIKNITESVMELSEENGYIGVSISLQNHLPTHDGIYKIFLDEPGKNVKEICKYILISSLKCHTEKSRYVFNQEAKIIISGNYEIDPINCTRVGKSNNFTIDLISGNEQAEFNLTIDCQDFIICVPISVFKHGFERNMQVNKPKYLWYSDFKNDFYIIMPGAIEAKLILSVDNKEYTSIGTHLGKGMFRFDTSEFANKIQFSKQVYSKITLIYRDNKERKLQLYKVLRKLNIERTSVFLDEDHNVAIDVRYIGNNDLSIKFIDMITGNFVVEKKVTNGKNYFPELSVSNSYKMVLYEVESDEFGFLEEKKQIGHMQENIGVIILDDVSDFNLIIRKIIFDGNSIRLNHLYYVINLIKIDEFTYKGTLLEQTSNINLKPKVKKVREVFLELLPDGGDLTLLSIQTEYDEDAYDPIYFDKKQSKLTSSENVTGNDYSRYIALYDDITEFETLLRRTPNVIQTS